MIGKRRDDRENGFLTKISRMNWRSILLIAAPFFNHPLEK